LVVSGPLLVVGCGTPQGVQESSRWSERSGDHRNAVKMKSHPGGVPDRCDLFDVSLRGLRLWSQHWLRACTPAGCRNSQLTTDNWPL